MIKRNVIDGKSLIRLFFKITLELVEGGLLKPTKILEVVLCSTLEIHTLLFNFPIVETATHETVNHL